MASSTCARSQLFFIENNSEAFQQQEIFSIDLYVCVGMECHVCEGICDILIAKAGFPCCVLPYPWNEDVASPSVKLWKTWEGLYKVTKIAKMVL